VTASSEGPPPDATQGRLQQPSEDDARAEQLRQLLLRATPGRESTIFQHDTQLDQLVESYRDVAVFADACLQEPEPPAQPDADQRRDDALTWFAAQRQNLLDATSLAAKADRVPAAVELSLQFTTFLVWRGQGQDALTHWRTLLAAARRTGDLRSEAIALTTLSVAMLAAKSYPEAADTAVQAAAVLQQIGDRAGEASALQVVGGFRSMQGRFGQAADAFRRAATLFGQDGRKSDESTALLDLGEALMRQRRAQDAIDVFHDVATIFEETGERRGMCLLFDRLGTALIMAGRFEEAVGVLHQALEFPQEPGEQYPKGRIFDGLATAQRKLGQTQDALDSYRQSVEAFREAGDRTRQGEALIEYGIALREAEHFDQAAEVHQQALEIFVELGGTCIGTARANLTLDHDAAKRRRRRWGR
jgi:tetratricopeptide (TPR) repeat protein